ncbi:molybdopterin oxidoreductase family protein [Saccharothrix obliqua]|uniref:molybdopterin oxidoreductase family protein n=1 Tax=Saccharothrix obliqua TaxID=2861747 RepID=UPI001C5E7CF1|nr:molybdopterin-dependent oxidoreductase [Saccharothrix obliqua]MBW4716891.1 molybdopterin-dependent oxidoreductase [Saccharothrix obliqua]
MAERDAVTDPWGERAPYGPGEEWPVRVDQHLVDIPDKWVRTASVLHSDGDALDLGVRDGRLVGVRGRAEDRVNRGRLDPKDVYGWQANASPDRLTRPLVREGSRLVEATWDEAMDRITARSRELLAKPGGWGRFGFHTSGQLFLEEYYTLSVIGKAGIGTPHMDGNTRLCTATAAAALKASFGTDGQPGSYTDVDHCDAIALWGHNAAETQAVLWSRVLDRRRGHDAPAMLAVDPRDTPVTAEADVHLAVRPGTNVALLNGLLREVIARGRVDEDFVRRRTLGFEALRATVEPYTSAHVADVCGVPAARVEEAAELVGTADRLFSTVLQGFYQSNQATAAACQVNNLHLLRGMIGRPGAGLCQMNGQPTAQNTRETGADGDLPGMRNWDNPEHIRELAELWRVDEAVIPHWSPPTHAMQVFRYAEQGSVELLWISATNPAVSLPELARIRRVLSREELFVVVQDIFLTETARLADVVLPAAAWGEKTGTFTNADRTVHLSDKAVEPPGEARPDLDIFLDYARRMDFRDRHGDPLIRWHDAESAYAAWQECSRGRPCDYTGIGYADLRSGSGVQWGGERLYAERFNTDPDYCESYGHDLATGAEFGAEEYRAKNPAGRAFLHAVAYEPGAETPTDEYPLVLTTGRTLYQFHTRTKTARAPELQAAAPEPWVQLHPDDARELGIADGDPVLVRSARGELRLPARVGGTRRGVVFVPFHYGYWDLDAAGPVADAGRAANELVATRWDPVSKQPLYKATAVAVVKEG